MSVYSLKHKCKHSRLAVSHITLHLLNVNLADHLALVLSVHVNVHDVLGNRLGCVSVSSPSIQYTDPISQLVVFILDDKDHVETGQDGGLEVDVLVGV
jgi:hypothetical protein